MKHVPPLARRLALPAVIVPLLALFIFVAMRSGPLAPVAVTVTTVDSRAISPALFGIGTVEARYTFRIGPTFAGRVRRLDVQVGDYVKAGQVLGEMDPVDLDDRYRALQAALRRAEAALREAEARQEFAGAQLHRYETLLLARGVSEEAVEARRQEWRVTEAALSAAREDIPRARADLESLGSQRDNLRLIAPVDGLVVSRAAEPGTTVVAGEAVVEVIDPASTWINVRFDQIKAAGLATGLSAQIVLRSHGGLALRGHVLRVEPLADAVTEEALAKVVFDRLPEPLPPIGELAEVTVALPGQPAAPAVPNAAIRIIDGAIGTWQIVDGDLRFTRVVLGVEGLDGQVQIREGLLPGDRIVVYSEKALSERSRIHVVEKIGGLAP